VCQHNLGAVMRLIKSLFLVIFSLILVIVAAWFVIPKDRIAKEALKRAEAQIGRAITVTGDVDMGIFPNLYVRMAGVSVANADWSEAGPMVTADQLRVGVALMPALSGDVQITELELVSPQIRLELSANGRANWEFGTPSTASEPATATASSDAGSSGPTVSLPLAKVTNGALSYRDHATGQSVTLRDVDARIKAPAFDAPATVAGRATYATGPITFDVTVGSLATLLSGQPAKATLSLGAAGGSVGFDGMLSVAPDVAGDLTFDIANTAGFASAFGVDMAAPPANLGASAQGTTAITASAKGANLSSLRLALGKNTVSGDLKIALGDVPMVSGSIALGDFDLRSGAAAASSGGSSGGSDASSGWSTAPIDASALHAVNANVGFSAQSIATDTLNMGAVAGTITIDAGRMVAALDGATAYSGQAKGQFVINARGGLSMAAQATGAGFEIQGLLSDLVDQDKVQGKTDFAIDLLAVGGSVDALIKSLKGNGNLAIKSGRWTGVDLDKVLRSGQVDNGTTVFDDMGASFQIANGVVDNQDLKFTLPNFETTGAGQIDLGNRMIDYIISPKATKARNGEGLSVPLRIKGSWDNPKLTADLQAAIDQNLAKEKAELEAKAKAKIEEEKKKLEDKAKAAIDAEKKRVEDQVKKSIGVETQDGQSIEDALKQKLQDEAAKGLLNLLGKK